MRVHNETLGEATERARKAVRERREAIDRVVSCLLAKESETILGDEFLKLWNEPNHECDCDDLGGNEEDSEPTAHESEALKSSGETVTTESGDVGTGGAAASSDKDGEGSNKS